MVLQPLLELVIKIAQKRLDINKSMIMLLPMMNRGFAIFQQITYQLLTFSKNSTCHVA